MYFAAYTIDGKDEPQDGPDVATTAGWNAWCEWIEQHAEEFPDCAHLAEEGWIEAGETLADLEHELTGVLHAIGDPNLSAVTAQILAAVKAAPEDATALMVTDGEPGGEDDEGDDGSENG